MKNPFISATVNSQQILINVNNISFIEPSSGLSKVIMDSKDSGGKNIILLVQENIGSLSVRIQAVYNQ
jgi:hypothetical protein